MKECKRTQSVNKPMGEAYSAYWSKWLEQGAQSVRQKLLSTDTLPQSPLTIFDMFAESQGGQAVFELARTNSNMPGFDVQSLLFNTAPDTKSLVRRWQKIAQAQSSIRFGTERGQTDFVQFLPSGEIVLSPSRIRPANLSKFGTAMLAGVLANALSDFSNGPFEVFESSKAGNTQELTASKSNNTLSFDPTSDIIFRISPSSTKRNTPSKQSPFLYLNHLFDHKAHPFFRQLIAQLEQHGPGHMNIERCAHNLGTSVRTLSRRLSAFGLSYGQLTRFVRLRHAVRQISAGETQMDEVAHHANYADRHHMARDFRRMTQISPTLLRDLFADSAPAKSRS